MKTAFVPEAGDFVWLRFDPQAGREQAERRPALVLTPKMYNTRSGSAFGVGLSDHKSGAGIPVRGSRPSGRGATGVILADQVKSVDWKACKAEPLDGCPDEVMAEARAKLAALLGY